MPFDGLEISPALKRAVLIDALRSPLPKHFWWDYRISGHCAMGLAVHLGLSRCPTIVATSRAIGISPIKGWWAFYNPIWVFTGTKPETVAKVIS
jgi:hypothetical protein